MRVITSCYLLISSALAILSCVDAPSAWAGPSATATSLTIASSGSALPSSGSVTSGSVVTLTAAVVAGSSKLTVGQVNFCDASVNYCTDLHMLGSAQLTSAGTAVFRFIPGVGSHSYKAVFLGTAVAATSTSAGVSLSVTGPYRTVTTIAQSGSVGNYTLTSTVGDNGSTAPSGSVSFLDTTEGNASLGTAPLAAAAPQFGFLNNGPQLSGLYGGGMLSADLNGDGIPDLVVTNEWGAPMAILLGNGDGTFAQTPTNPAVPIGNGFVPNQIGPTAVGDFNGDGVQDLATVDLGALYILLGNGGGTFTVKSTNVTIASASTPNAIAVGDFNDDGKLDLAITIPGSNAVTVLLGNGDGTFAATASSQATGSRSSAIAVGDFNGDGKLDLAVTNETSNTVTILLGNGDGTFTATAASPTTGNNPVGMTVGDLNGDGKLDLAVINGVSNGGSVTVLLGNGDGTFNTATISPATTSTPYQIAVGDFNGDGILDLIVTEADSEQRPTAQILLGNGDGTFTTQSINLPLYTSPGGIATGDFNGDGIPDLATSYAENDLLVFLTESQTATATASGIAAEPFGSGANLVAASYSGDTHYAVSTSASTTLTAAQGTPVVSVTASPNPASAGSSVTLTATVTGPGLTPTGTVTFYDSFGQLGTGTLNSSGVGTYATSAFTAGSYSITATYSGDANYLTATSPAAALTITPVTPKTPTVTVQPSTTTITTAQSLSVAVTVSGGPGNPTPTGSVTLTSGNYASAATGLSSGGATITIPAGSLPAGTVTLTVSYAGDTNYASATGTAPVTVTNPSFTIAGTAVSVAPGATTGNTSTITITPAGGFTGNIALTAALASGPAGASNPPSYSFGATTPVSITGAGVGTATLTIATTAEGGCSQTASRVNRGLRSYTGSGAILACILLLGIPARRRAWHTILLGLVVLFIASTGGVVACGGSNQGKRHFLAALFWVCFGFKLGMWSPCGHGGLGWMKGWRQLKALPGVGGTGLRRRSGGSWS